MLAMLSVVQSFCLHAVSLGKTLEPFMVIASSEMLSFRC